MSADPLRSVRQVLRGLRTTDRYGAHPGTPIVLASVAIGAAVGGAGGAGIVLAIVLPLYLVGAYERGR